MPDNFTHQRCFKKCLFLQGALYAELLKLRGQLASHGGYAPYMIASNKQMIDIAKYR